MPVTTLTRIKSRQLLRIEILSLVRLAGTHLIKLFSELPWRDTIKTSGGSVTVDFNALFFGLGRFLIENAESMLIRAPQLPKICVHNPSLLHFIHVFFDFFVFRQLSTRLNQRWVNPILRCTEIVLFNVVQINYLGGVFFKRIFMGVRCQSIYQI